MCMTDYEHPEFYFKTTRKAKKQHRCGECGREIAPKESYQYACGKWEGDFLEYKTCVHCLRGQDLLLRECGGFLFGGIGQDLCDHIYPGLPWAMEAARIIVGMRREWRRFDGVGLMN